MQYKKMNKIMLFVLYNHDNLPCVQLNKQYKDEQTVEKNGLQNKGSLGASDEHIDRTGFVHVSPPWVLLMFSLRWCWIVVVQKQRTYFYFLVNYIMKIIYFVYVCFLYKQAYLPYYIIIEYITRSKRLD